LFNIEREDGKYLFSKYDWTSKNEFYMEFIDADYMKANFKDTEVTTKNLRAFITENINKKELFGDKMKFYRKNSPEYYKVFTLMQKSRF